MNIVVTDNRISNKAKEALLSHGFEIVALPSFAKLSEPVSAHPDMLLFILDNFLFTDTQYYYIAKNAIDYICKSSGLKLILCDTDISSHYPLDIPFNILKCGNTLFCKSGSTAKEILDTAIIQGYDIVDVSQGYTKCSVCKVSDKAIITADMGIAISAREHGIDVLTISAGNVILPPYKYGFIGGSSGLYDNCLYFCGNITLHPDYETINSFCKKHNAKIASLSDEPLTDVGTLMFL